MEKDNFKYNAFISYRHNDLDKFVAENLHRLIETYIMPKSVVEKYNITDNNVRRVFRDQDELPLASNLEEPIIEALKDSKFLIVICSPRLKESIWCKKEIENFIRLHGRSNILCVLAEGEPKDSFPEILQYYEEKVKDENGKEIIKKIPCEPLAMDVRGNNEKEIYKNLKNELIRIIAPMYNLDYDDIKQRHEERKLKRRANIFKAVAVVSLLFAAYSIFLFSRIYISSEQLKNDQAISLAEEASDLLLKDDRIGAIEKAYQSVTKYNNIKMPLTTKGIYELTDSLGVYYLPFSYNALSQLDTLGIVDSVKISSDRNYLLSHDNSGEIVLWDFNSEKRIKTIIDAVSFGTKEIYTFVGNKYVAYISNTYEIIILNLNGEEIQKIQPEFFAENISASKNGKYIQTSSNHKIAVYETDTFKKVAAYELPEDMEIKDEKYFDEKEENLLFISSKWPLDYSDIDILTLNINDNKITGKIKIDADKVNRIIFKDDNAVVLSTRSFITDMILTKYNYIDGRTDYQKEFKGEYSLDMKMNYANKEGNYNILVATYNSAIIIDYNTGDEKNRFTIGEDIANIYTYDDAERYILFTTNGNVHVFEKNNDEFKDSNYSIYESVFNLNLPKYKEFIFTGKVIYTYTSSDNRIIKYGFLNNDDIQEIEYERKKFETIGYNEMKALKDEYHFEKEYLINYMFYANDQKTLFVAYKNDILEIYNNETKKLIKTVGQANYLKHMQTCRCKTQNDEYIICGDGYGGYILNKDFDLIAYVPRLYDYNNDKIIMKSGDNKFYDVKLYTQDEIINKGREYLMSKSKIED